MELISLQVTYITNSFDEFWIIVNLLKEVPFIDRKLLQKISKYSINFEQAILTYKSEMEKLMKLKCKDKEHFGSIFITKLFDYSSYFNFKEMIHLV